MNFLQKYYQNTTHFVCAECKHCFTISFWKWLATMKFDMTRHRYVKCPRCGRWHWLQAERKEK